MFLIALMRRAAEQVHTEIERIQFILMFSWSVIASPNMIVRED